MVYCVVAYATSEEIFLEDLQQDLLKHGLYEPSKLPEGKLLKMYLPCARLPGERQKIFIGLTRFVRTRIIRSSIYFLLKCTVNSNTVDQLCSQEFKLSSDSTLTPLNIIHC